MPRSSVSWTACSTGRCPSRHRSGWRFLRRPRPTVAMDDAPVVVLSHGLWQPPFGADPQVLGRTVMINRHAFTVIGIAPREFTGTSRGQLPDLYVPITMYGQLTNQRPGGESPLASR